jgi:DNA-binding MarR family transcriptional regulator
MTEPTRTAMTETKVANVVGALSLALADNLLGAAQNHGPRSAPAAAIALVRHVPGMTIEQLRHALGLSHPGAVRLVDRLVEESLVYRDRSDHDGRAVALRVTPRGETMVQHLLEARQNALTRALAGLSVADRQVLGHLAETMLRGMLQGVDHAFAVCRLCDPAICHDCPVDDEIGVRITRSRQDVYDG